MIFNPGNPVMPILNQSTFTSCVLSHDNNKNKHVTRQGKPCCVNAYPQKAINLLNVVVHPENRDKEPQELFTFLELLF